MWFDWSDFPEVEDDDNCREWLKEELEGLDLLAQARRLGELAAWQFNKMADTGVESHVEYDRIENARAITERIADIVGKPAWDAFAAGFDEAIDFSLNADWQT